MLHYADSTAKCRSQTLLSYFGEKNPYRYGECDVCRRRNQLDLSTYEFDLINKEAKEILKEKPVKVEILVNQIKCDETKVLKVIRWLIDNNKIEYTIDKRLIWVK